MDGEPVCRAKRLVDVPEARRQRGRLLAVEQRIAFLVDGGRVILRLAAELVGVLEHLAMPRGNLGAARVRLVGREPERIERLEPGRGFAARPVPRADDVMDEVTLVLGQVELVRRHARRVAGHHVVVMEPHRRRRAAEQVAVLAVPEREQHVAVRAQEDADLGVLARAVRPALRDGSWRGSRQQRQLEDLGGLVAEFRKLLEGVRREVFLVQHPRHRQHDAERHAELQGLLGHDAVGAVSERRHHDDDAAGVLVAQTEQAVAHARADDRDLVGHEVPVPGDGDDERNGVAACAGPAVRTGGEGSFSGRCVLGCRRHARG